MWNSLDIELSLREREDSSASRMRCNFTTILYSRAQISLGEVESTVEGFIIYDHFITQISNNFLSADLYFLYNIIPKLF